MTWKFAVILGTVQRNLRQKPAFSEEIRESHFNFSEWSVNSVILLDYIAEHRPVPNSHLM